MRKISAPHRFQFYWINATQWKWISLAGIKRRLKSYGVKIHAACVHCSKHSQMLSHAFSQRWNALSEDQSNHQSLVYMNCRSFNSFCVHCFIWAERDIYVAKNRRIHSVQPILSTHKMLPGLSLHIFLLFQWPNAGNCFNKCIAINCVCVTDQVNAYQCPKIIVKR